MSEHVETVWEALFGADRGAAIREGLALIASADIPVEEIDRAILRIHTEPDLGPLLKPGAAGAGRCRNAAEFAEVLRGLRRVVRVLASPEIRRRELGS